MTRNYILEISDFLSIPVYNSWEEELYQLMVSYLGKRLTMIFPSIRACEATCSHPLSRKCNHLCLIEGVSKCMIASEEAQANISEYRNVQGPHGEVYTDRSKINEKVGAAAVINRHFQNGCAELLLAHGSCTARCYNLPWLNGRR